MGVEFITTDNQNDDFIKLTVLLDRELDDIYGELQKEYKKHNKVDFIKDVVILYADGEPVACGAFKEYTGDSVEMKRVFVKAEHRRTGLSKLIMAKLEEIAESRGYSYAILQTGSKQHEAISLYKNLGYEAIANYGVYIGDSNSVCMRKGIKK